MRLERNRAPSCIAEHLTLVSSSRLCAPAPCLPPGCVAYPASFLCMRMTASTFPGLCAPLASSIAVLVRPAGLLSILMVLVLHMLVKTFISVF